jgi:hypothetical protein
MSNEKGSGELVRALDWRGRLLGRGRRATAGAVLDRRDCRGPGKLAFLVWIISMIMGFLQSFTYAEMAGMFGNKSGGTSVYGATAWLRYSKLIAPLSVWCNWFAWSPVLSLGCAIAAGYILNALFPIPLAESQMVLDWVAAKSGQLYRETPRGRIHRRQCGYGTCRCAINGRGIRRWRCGTDPGLPHMGGLQHRGSGPWHSALQLDLPDRRHPDADHPDDPAPRHRLDRVGAESGWRSSCLCRCCWSVWCRS